MDYLPYKMINIKLKLLKLDFGNYILCLIKLHIAIFCIIILNILCILYRFGSFCKHFATITLHIIKCFFNKFNTF